MPDIAWILNAWSKAAGYARALITVLTAFVVFLTASGPVFNQPVVAKITAALLALIQILTRFTGLGNKPPTVSPEAPAAPQVGEAIQP